MKHRASFPLLDGRPWQTQLTNVSVLDGVWDISSYVAELLPAVHNPSPRVFSAWTTQPPLTPTLTTLVCSQCDFQLTHWRRSKAVPLFEVVRLSLYNAVPSEMDIGPNFLTRPYTTHIVSDPTQPTRYFSSEWVRSHPIVSLLMSWCISQNWT